MLLKRVEDWFQAFLGKDPLHEVLPERTIVGRAPQVASISAFAVFIGCLES